MSDVTARILVVTDRADPTPALLDAVERRAVEGDAQFRVVVLNPAHAELHLLHPERHDLARAAEEALHRASPLLESAAGGRVIGSVSVRHDPMDAIEETINNEPINEIILAVPTHHLATWTHQDLPHRLKHLGLPVTTVPQDKVH
jgi:hypothetical protein